MITYWTLVVFPTVLGLFFIGFSVWKLWTNRDSIGHMILSIVNVLLNGFAVHMLIQMLNGAWPTILPHLMILVTIPFVLIQWKYVKEGEEEREEP